MGKSERTGNWIAAELDTADAYDDGFDAGAEWGFEAAKAKVDALVAALLPRVSPGELRLGEVQELRAAVAALKPE